MCERRDVVESAQTDPEVRLGFTVGDPRVSDAEIDRLCEERQPTVAR
jgi:hypothetical protein